MPYYVVKTKDRVYRIMNAEASRPKPSLDSKVIYSNDGWQIGTVIGDGGDVLKVQNEEGQICNVPLIDGIYPYLGLAKPNFELDVPWSFSPKDLNKHLYNPKDPREAALTEFFQLFGDSWKDDTGAVQLDNFNITDAVKVLLNYLPKEGVDYEGMVENTYSSLVKKCEAAVDSAPVEKEEETSNAEKVKSTLSEALGSWYGEYAEGFKRRTRPKKGYGTAGISGSSGIQGMTGSTSTGITYIDPNQAEELAAAFAKLHGPDGADLIYYGDPGMLKPKEEEKKEAPNMDEILLDDDEWEEDEVHEDDDDYDEGDYEEEEDEDEEDF